MGGGVGEVVDAASMLLIVADRLGVGKDLNDDMSHEVLDLLGGGRGGDDSTDATDSASSLASFSLSTLSLLPLPTIHHIPEDLTLISSVFPESISPATK